MPSTCSVIVEKDVVLRVRSNVAKSFWRSVFLKAIMRSLPNRLWDLRRRKRCFAIFSEDYMCLSKHEIFISEVRSMIVFLNLRFLAI